MRRMVGAWILVAALGCGFEDDMVVDEPDETEPDSPADDPDDDNGEPEPKPQHPLDIKVDVPVVGPYGARTVR
ncbi:MAG: hypothetical protein KJO07_11760, partial [Deltaproteobacteria bacterium]|nr:hypothetical protein [Deltaproteobacteria bacterium]